MHLHQLATAPLAAALLLSHPCLAQWDEDDNIFYDETWAGPVRLAANRATVSPASLGFTSVEATLVMPPLALPDKPSEVVDQYTAAWWVGLDGFLPSAETPASTIRGLWQAGVFMSIWQNGTTSYTGFHEW